MISSPENSNQGVRETSPASGLANEHIRPNTSEQGDETSCGYSTSTQFRSAPFLEARTQHDAFSSETSFHFLSLVIVSFPRNLPLLCLFSPHTSNLVPPPIPSPRHCRDLTAPSGNQERGTGRHGQHCIRPRMSRSRGIAKHQNRHCSSLQSNRPVGIDSRSFSRQRQCSIRGACESLGQHDKMNSRRRFSPHYPLREGVVLVFCDSLTPAG